MKLFKINPILAFFSAVALSGIMSTTQAYSTSTNLSLQPAWIIEGIDTPESVIEVSYKHQNYFLVSAIEGDYFTKDGKGSLVKINGRGEILDLHWVSGLNAPKGLAQYKDKVYVADIDQIVIVDIKNASIVEKISVPEAIFLNDVTVDQQGTVYVSDTGNGRIYRLKDHKVDVYLEGLTSPNGLWAEPDRLLVGAANQLIGFDKHKQPKTISADFPMDIDGITPWKCNSYLVSSWAGQISFVSKKGEQTLLLDSVAEGINTADIMYSEKAKLLFVPNFFHNSVSAYRVNN
jgi:hypothetical protein